MGCPDWGTSSSNPNLFSACAKCEIKVVLRSVAAKANLLKSLVYVEDAGRIVSKSVAGFPLLAVGGRLEPSEHLHNVGALEGVAVGTTRPFQLPFINL